MCVQQCTHIVFFFIFVFEISYFFMKTIDGKSIVRVYNAFPKKKMKWAIFFKKVIKNDFKLKTAHCIKINFLLFDQKFGFNLKIKVKKFDLFLITFISKNHNLNKDFTIID